MSAGDPGPYMGDTDVWVPRTVPFVEARRLAKSDATIEPWQRLRYVGKDDATLFGFTRDCECEDECALSNRCRTCHEKDYWCGCETPDIATSRPCRVPAWHFEVVEP